MNYMKEFFYHKSAFRTLQLQQEQIYIKGSGSAIIQKRIKDLIYKQ